MKRNVQHQTTQDQDQHLNKGNAATADNKITKIPFKPRSQSMTCIITLIKMTKSRLEV
jgi:hypothetical protein